MNLGVDALPSAQPAPTTGGRDPKPRSHICPGFSRLLRSPSGWGQIQRASIPTFSDHLRVRKRQIKERVFQRRAVARYPLYSSALIWFGNTSLAPSTFPFTYPLKFAAREWCSFHRMALSYGHPSGAGLSFTLLFSNTSLRRHPILSYNFSTFCKWADFPSPHFTCSSAPGIAFLRFPQSSPESAPSLRRFLAKSSPSLSNEKGSPTR